VPTFLFLHLFLGTSRIDLAITRWMNLCDFDLGATLHRCLSLQFRYSKLHTSIMNALYQSTMDRLAIRFDQLSLNERPETQVPWTWKFSSTIGEPYVRPGTPVPTPRQGRRDNPPIPPPEDDKAKKLLLLLLQGPNHRKRSTKQLKGQLPSPT
jgi:hypothetical protein